MEKEHWTGSQGPGSGSGSGSASNSRGKSRHSLPIYQVDMEFVISLLPTHAVRTAPSNPSLSLPARNVPPHSVVALLTKGKVRRG